MLVMWTQQTHTHTHADMYVFAAPQEKLPLPLVAAWHGSLSLRPDETHRWSETVLPCSTLSLRLARPLLSLCLPAAARASAASDAASHEEPTPFACVVALEPVDDNIFSERWYVILMLEVCV